MRQASIPVTVRREGDEVYVNLDPNDVIDLKQDDDVGNVIIVLDGEPIAQLKRIAGPPGENGKEEPGD